MRLSTVFELLLIFLLIAFAAYGRVIGKFLWFTFKSRIVSWKKKYVYFNKRNCYKFDLMFLFLDRDEVTSLRRVIRATEGRAKQGNLGVSILSLNQATESLNKYCTCDKDVCQCCRDFHIPVVSLKGPGIFFCF